MKRKIISVLLVIILIAIFSVIKTMPPKHNKEQDSVQIAQQDTTIDYIKFHMSLTVGENNIMTLNEWDKIFPLYPDTIQAQIKNKELFLVKNIQGADIFFLAVNIIDGVINEYAVVWCIWGKDWNKMNYNDKMIQNDLKLFMESFLIEAYDYPINIIEFDSIYIYNNENKNIFYLIGKGHTDSLQFSSAIPLKFINDTIKLYYKGITHLCQSKDNSYCCTFSYDEIGDITGCENCSDMGWCNHTITTPIPISENMERFFTMIAPYNKIK